MLRWTRRPSIVYAVNVKSVYLGAVHAVLIMRQQGGGAILNIASTAGVRPRPGLTWYNGSKGAVITLTKSMAAELASDGIRQRAEPGHRRDRADGRIHGRPRYPEIRKKFVATIPLGRMEPGA